MPLLLLLGVFDEKHVGVSNSNKEASLGYI